SQILTSTHEFKQLQETHALVHAQLLNSVSNVEFQQLQEANKSLETQLASKLVDIDAARLRLMQAGESIRATQSRHAQLQQVSSQALSDSAQKQRQLEAQVQQLQAQLLSATQEMATKEAELEAVRVELFAAQLAGRPGTQPAQSVSAAAFAEMEAAEAEAAANRVETPQLPMHFVLELTGNFTPLACLGSGRTGAYYQCMMGDQLVAVKRLLPQESADPTQFRSEIELLARLSHPNVVPLYFYAEEGSDRCMVFEHMKHGSVRDRLSLKNNTPPLSWQQRHAIAVGVAEAMRFVQQAIPRSPVFHLNLKSSNVLLDNHFVAKITDFGLSRSPPVASSKHIFRQGIQHSMQYLCPEYRDEGKVSLKTDVFSFGMLLFELLTGQEPSLNLRGNARREIRRNQHARATFDTTIAWSEASTAQAEQVCNLAIDCMEEARMYRPSFTDALEILGVAVPGPPPAADENDGARERECLICLSAPTTAKLMPCRHACLCTECATTLMQRNERCPVCRGHIESFETGNFLQTFVAQRS
ncbi:hypothetical protein CAOG_08893, partial [Capsaspora owczarzaki ATCC 30864]|uniref:hypothetical protein n=1 Tax=Capsaspora owczarzaki (strain ATCC 30864) TaxID=595528 RepID=UPI0003526039